MAFVSVCLVFLACVGSGAALMRVLRITAYQQGWTCAVWSFAVGFGAIGWLGFFLALAGSLATLDLAIFCAVCAAGIVVLRPATFRITVPAPFTPWTVAMLLAALAVIAISMLQAISPPTDADSLAYHFALPKQFIQNGALEFVPRAADGAVPLLVHMTYMVVYGMGGELALTMWAGLTSGMAAAFLYVVARRYLDLSGALATALLFMTVPAFIYGGVSGQVEIKLSLFVIGATFAVVEAHRTGQLGYIALAGLLAGCYAGSKYLGLFFAVACAVPLLLHRQRITHITVYGLCVLAAGSQWYVWNWAHTGDPVFPVMFQALGLPDSAIWNREQDAIFRDVFYAAEVPLPTNPIWYILYPLKATLAPLPNFESDRTGLGPFVLLALPFVAMGMWRGRARIWTSELRTVALVAFAFYTVWFFGGASQRIRHLLPIYPIILICVMAAAWHKLEDFRFAAPFVGAIGLTLLLQLSGQLLFGWNFIHRAVAATEDEQFFKRMVAAYEPVPWINKNLTQRDKILITHRQLTYLIDIPVLMAHPVDLATVELRLTTQNPPKFLAQLRSEGVTHLMAPLRPSKFISDRAGNLGLFAHRLVSAGCAEIVSKFEVASRPSRTISSGVAPTDPVAIYAITKPACPV